MYSKETNYRHFEEESDEMLHISKLSQGMRGRNHHSNKLRNELEENAISQLKKRLKESPWFTPQAEELFSDASRWIHLISLDLTNYRM